MTTPSLIDAHSMSVIWYVAGPSASRCQFPSWQTSSSDSTSCRGHATNGLLRQYVPKGTDLSIHSEPDLDRVADELNDRPRKRFGFYKPTERLAELLLR